MNKNLFNFKNFVMSLALFLFVSCSSDECAECHLVVMNEDGSETELLDLGEYCEDELHDIEDNGYTFTNTFTVDSDGNDLSTPVAPGDATEVHCGEEHNHDH